jgi:competence protein CoiA
MQIYALDQDKKLVFAVHAAKQKNYFCLECQGLVRCRGGSHRQVHFYHLATTHSCRLNGKSMAHLQIQYYLKSLFSDDECFLEYRFPTINRIADVVWESKKIIFEVQCSFITADEVEARNRDYSSLGYQVIWILHDKRYNQERVSEAEKKLLNSPHYFSNFDNAGKGIIYDQFAIVNKGIRSSCLAPLPILLHQPKMQADGKGHWINLSKWRSKHWPIFFSGDLVDISLKEEKSLEDMLYLKQAAAAEEAFESMAKKPLMWWQKIVRLYWLYFQMILERACK